MRPRGNALPPTAGRCASLWHQITNERGGTRGRRVCCLEQLSSPSLSPARTRASHVCMASQKDIVFLPLDFLPEPSQMSQDTKRNGERKVS